MDVNYKILAKKISEIIDSKKGKNTIIYDVKNLATFTDFIILTTVNSAVQANALLKELNEKISQKPHHIEGESNQGWVLLDYNGVIVNIFTPEEREFYGLERLWGEAGTVGYK